MAIETHIFLVRNTIMIDYLYELVKNEESVYNLSGAAQLPDAQGLYFTKKSILPEFPRGALLMVQMPKLEVQMPEWNPYKSGGAAWNKVKGYFSHLLEKHERAGKLDDIGIFRDILSYKGFRVFTHAQP